MSMNPNLTRNELRQIMRDTADKIGGVVYDANGHNDDYGFGRVNAHQAVQRAANSIYVTPDRYIGVWEQLGGICQNWIHSRRGFSSCTTSLLFVDD
nr:hypothetical protein [Chroococcidiopsis sp. CCMEE 29]